ncbi:MAG: hypothetical protein HQ464_04075 [Planctomycetes bacterium]|nr:hypothetical protein [Planctomycetota bacterium]
MRRLDRVSRLLRWLTAGSDCGAVGRKFFPSPLFTASWLQAQMNPPAELSVQNDEASDACIALPKRRFPLQPLPEFSVRPAARATLTCSLF